MLVLLIFYKEWNWSKKIERFLKTYFLNLDAAGISAIEPPLYQQRFFDKVKEITVRCLFFSVLHFKINLFFKKNIMLSHYWIKRGFKLTKMLKKSKFHFFKIDSKMDLDDL